MNVECCVLGVGLNDKVDQCVLRVSK
jgi:hypothetical protein